MMLLSLVAAALAALDPCAPIAPAAHVDSSLAATYATVGEEEQAAERRETAITAFRDALHYDPANARARAALMALCQASKTPPNKLFDEGLRRLQAGDWREAAELFAHVRETSADPGAALLEGIARYELGEDRAALRALHEAMAQHSLSDAALLFQGLVAYRQNQRARASELFRLAAASADPRLQASAADLLKLSRDQGRLVFSAQVESGYDTNVSLAPNGDPSLSSAKDGFVAAEAALTAEPWVTHGPFASISAGYRKQFVLSAYDLGAVSGTAGWEFGGPRLGFTAQYTFDALTFGERAYLNGHRLLAEGHTAFGPLGLGVNYSIRREFYLEPDLADFSGWLQSGQARAIWTFPAGSSIEADYTYSYDSAEIVPLTYREHGPHAAVSWRATRSLRLGIEGYFWMRSYLAAGDGETEPRSDHVGEGDFVGEISLADHWAVRLMLTARAASSTDPEFIYSKYVASLGVSYLTGLF